MDIAVQVCLSVARERRAMAAVLSIIAVLAALMYFPSRVLSLHFRLCLLEAVFVLLMQTTGIPSPLLRQAAVAATDGRDALPHDGAAANLLAHHGLAQKQTKKDIAVGARFIVSCRWNRDPCEPVVGATGGKTSCPCMADKSAYARDISIEGEKDMNWDQIKGQWNQYTGKAREKWGDLTDDDLERAAGNRDQLIGVIQQRYGIAREDAERQVDSWSNNLG